MDDPWSSVPAMLRWHLDGLKQRINENLARWPSAIGAFDLPKASDGLPEGWSFGKLTHDDIKTQTFMSALVWVRGHIAKAEEAIARNDLVAAVAWTFNASDALWSATAHATSSDLTRMWRYVDKSRRRASERAIKGNRLRTKYDRKERAEWHRLWEGMRSSNSNLCPNSAAPIIARRRGLSSSAASSIRRELKSK